MRLQEELGAVRRERALTAERSEAWSLLATPEGLEGWLADEVDLDAVEPGAEGVLRWDDGDERSVVVEEVVDGRRVAMRWSASDGPAPDTLVEVTLDDHEDGGTLVRVIELPLRALEVAGAPLPVTAGGASSGGPVLL